MRAPTATLILASSALWPTLAQAGEPAGIAAPASRSFPAPRLKLAPGARKVYVSTRFGDDRNAGRVPELPLRTIAKAKTLLRHGKGDWLLLRRGDTFTETIGHWKWGGRSAEFPARIGTYGKGRRPVLRTGSQSGLITRRGSGSPQHISHLVVQDLDFYAHTRDPGAPSYRGPEGLVGVFWLIGGEDVRLVGCRFRSYGTGLVLQDNDRAGLRQVLLRRCQVLDSYGVKGHSQGLYADGIDGLTIEACLFDHNGWHPTAKGARATIFNHNIYIQSNCRRAVLRRNIILRAASHGAQVRCGGVVEENVFARNPIALLIGGGDHPVPGGVTASVKGNVILEGRDIRKGLPRGWGIDLVNIKRAEVRDTIVANVMLTGVNTRSIAKDPRTTFHNVIVHRWPGNASFPERAWSDPDRSLAGFHTARGGAGGWQGLVKRLRSGWDPGYSAGALLAWIRAGFQPR